VLNQHLIDFARQRIKQASQAMMAPTAPSNVAVPPAPPVGVSPPPPASPPVVATTTQPAGAPGPSIAPSARQAAAAQVKQQGSGKQGQ